MRKKLFLAIAILVLSSSFHLSNASSLPTEPDPVKVKAAIEAYNSLSKKDKRVKAKEIKTEIKAYNAAKKAGKEPSTNTLLLVILAILLPPLAVYLHEGEINNRFWISLILTLLFWLPGVIYALIVILGDE